MKSLIKKLSKKKLKISFAESCTGGMLANSITSVSGASKVFNLGLITYSNLSRISKANINVSITGIAGPNGGTKKKPIGLVYIGVKKGNKILINRNIFKSKKRIPIQKETVKKAIKIINSLI